MDNNMPSLKKVSFSIRGSMEIVKKEEVENVFFGKFEQCEKKFKLNKVGCE